jgi:hypothetical protein
MASFLKRPEVGQLQQQGSDMLYPNPVIRDARGLTIIEH